LTLVCLLAKLQAECPQQKQDTREHAPHTVKNTVKDSVAPAPCACIFLIRAALTPGSGRKNTVSIITMHYYKHEKSWQLRHRALLKIT
jgi:hypothetical protein